jgi:hypothetical protein
MAYIQPDLFDAMPIPAPVAPKTYTLSEDLKSYAFLYTATEKGNNSGIKFAMSLTDAMAWCASPLSRGAVHQTEWAYFWTSVWNFIDCHWGMQEPRLSLKGVTDNGQWDERIASLGLKKIHFSQFKALFGPMGVEVVA